MKGDPYAQNQLPHIITLMYHRIDMVDTNPWGICISPKNFEKHIRSLKENFNIIAVDELMAQIKSGSIAEKTVCITFDDGYADNYIYAKPILEKYNCAATFFIATTFVNQVKSFWWDELEMIFLHSKKLPIQLSLYFNDEKIIYELSEDDLTKQQLSQHRKWRWHQQPPTDRCKIFLSIWGKLTALTLEEIEIVLSKIKQWSHWEQRAQPQRLPMNAKQLRGLSSNDLFTLALHTHRHGDLSQQPKQIQLKEITLCKDFLHNEFNIASSYFSYPFGRCNAETIQLAKELKFTACFTTDAVPINAKSNKLLLGRYQPFNWNERTFQKQLDAWFCNKAQVIDTTIKQ